MENGRLILTLEVRSASLVNFDNNGKKIRFDKNGGILLLIGCSSDSDSCVNQRVLNAATSKISAV